MDFPDIFNIVNFLKIFVENKNQLVLFEKLTDHFSLLIGMYLYNKYSTRLI